MPFEVGNKAGYKHGHHKTPEYQCWADIKMRCLNPANRFFKDYGGRGIKICDKWNDSFEAFLADVGSRPTARHTIDKQGEKDDQIWQKADRCSEGSGCDCQGRKEAGAPPYRPISE